MSSLGISIVIATRNRTSLLERTLNSIAACERPETLRRIIVAENGPDKSSKALVESFQSRLPIEYRHDPEATKCGSLNRAIAGLDNELVILFDDDVRLHPDTLTAYAEAADGREKGAFFGGCCLVDYEEAPEPWLHRYLPYSAKGWSMGPVQCEIFKPRALGFNWAVFTTDLRAVGCFDERCGPGTGANSDEVVVQEKLFQNGVKGYFLPTAIAWHYVPRDRCSPEWVLNRNRQNETGRAIARYNAPGIVRLRRQIAARVRLVTYGARIVVGTPFLDSKTLFYLRFKLQGFKGTIEGMKRASISRKDGSKPENPGIVSETSPHMPPAKTPPPENSTVESAGA